MSTTRVVSSRGNWAASARTWSTARETSSKAARDIDRGRGASDVLDVVLRPPASAVDQDYNGNRLVADWEAQLAELKWFCPVRHVVIGRGDFRSGELGV